MTRAFLALMVCCTAASPALASNFEALDVGLSGGLLLASPKGDLLGDLSQDTALTDGAASGVRAGFRFRDLPLTSQVSLVAFPAHYHPGILKGTGVLANMEVLTHLSLGTVELNAGGGVGVLALVAGSAGEDTDLAYSAGGGVRWTPPSSSVALRMDARGLLSDGLGADLAIHTLLTIGVDFVLSRHASPVADSRYPNDDDGDGIVNARDLCPTAPGLARLSGCPDRDRDGVADDRDDCPNSPGLVAFYGCPDTDGDAVPDTSDACPTIAGAREHAGCPDSDADGIADREDQCKARPGSLQRAGCPEPPAQVLAMFGRPFDSLRFSGRPPKLALESYETIRGIVRVMEDHPDLDLQVRGYTHDKVSPEAAFLESETRASIIVRALIEEGADPARVSAVGLGSAQPIASNRSRAGRSRNHRVELHIVKQGAH